MDWIFLGFTILSMLENPPFGKFHVSNFAGFLPANFLTCLELARKPFGKPYGLKSFWNHQSVDVEEHLMFEISQGVVPRTF